MAFGSPLHSQSTSLARVTIVPWSRYALFATKRRQPYRPEISRYGLFRHALARVISCGTHRIVLLCSSEKYLQYIFL
ncbi:hypothetical protein JOE21_003162 [Desmospora profundinema]|uniref:Uncharacterized protein n=1 Tax=Desmospora profundinema TaxID=1571184 RepID=A0ABU1IQS3_9BACL|nr:hypothetical protein [Desmospora profundinema]